MRVKHDDAALDYRSFSNPYAGLAAMIFVQADNDLRALNGEDHTYKDGCLLQKWEIINFLRSPWAALLATGCGVDVSAIERYAARAIRWIV